MVLVLPHKKKCFILFVSLGSHGRLLSAASLFSLYQEKEKEKSSTFSLDMSIKRITLAGTLSSEEYHSCQLKQNLYMVPFSLSLLDNMVFMSRPNLTLQLLQNQTVLYKGVQSMIQHVFLFMRYFFSRELLSLVSQFHKRQIVFKFELARESRPDTQSESISLPGCVKIIKIQKFWLFISSSSAGLFIYFQIYCFLCSHVVKIYSSY